MITEHRNYREYLRSQLAKRVSINPAYSLRLFAKTLGLAHSSLAEILSGKKNLSVDRAVTIASKLELNGNETDYFVKLIQYQNAKSEGLKSIALEKLNDTHPQQNIFDLSVDHFRTISEWYHIPMLLMADLADFEATPQNMAQRLGISKVEAEAAVNRLERLGLAEISPNGSMKRTANHLLAKSTSPNEALKKFHHQMLEKGTRAIDTQTTDQRFTGTRTFSLNTTDQTKVADLTRDYLNKLSALAERSNNSDQIYHAFVNVFQLTDQKGLDS